MAGRRTVIGVMGGGSADATATALAEELGRRIAEAGWTLLTGGRPAGVMEAASRGAAAAGGLVVGVLPDSSPAAANPWVELVIATGLNDARNLINVLSSDVVVACPGGAGTLSEVALALKNDRPLVLLGFDPGPLAEAAAARGRLLRADNPAAAIDCIRRLLA